MSLASESSSRMAAMRRAEKTIDGIRNGLNLKLHRIRKESIDEELFDVISGYEALTAIRRPRGMAFPVPHSQSCAHLLSFPIGLSRY